MIPIAPLARCQQQGTIMTPGMEKPATNRAAITQVVVHSVKIWPYHPVPHSSPGSTFDSSTEKRDFFTNSRSFGLEDNSATTLRTPDRLRSELSLRQKSSESDQKRTRRDPVQDTRFHQVQNGKHKATFVESVQLAFGLTKHADMVIRTNLKCRPDCPPTRTPPCPCGRSLRTVTSG